MLAKYIHPQDAKFIRLFTSDIISEYALEKSFNFLDQIKDSTFRVPFLDMFDMTLLAIVDLTYNPTLRRTALLLPKSMLTLLDKRVAEFANFFKVSSSYVWH